MSAKIQRKANAAPVSYKIKPAGKARSSASKNRARSNGKYPLANYAHLHIGIVECSLDGNYIDVNEEFCRILGYSEEQLLQMGIKQCTHEDDYALDIKLHEQLVAGKIPYYELEKRFIRKDGQIIWVELTRSLVRDEDGKPVCTMGVVIDISEHKNVERALRESAENLRLATEAARIFKWELDFQKQLVTFSDNFVQVLGFSASLLPQNNVETVWKLSPEEDVRTVAEAIAKAIKNHTNLNSLQYRMINPEDGRTVWLEVNAKIVYDQAGNAQRMFGVAQNISKNKRAEELERSAAANLLAVAEANAKFRAFFDQGSNFAGVMALDGTLLEANRLCLDFCGFKREDVIGKRFWDCGWWNPSPALMEMIRRGTRAAADGKLFRQETTYFLADGSERYVDLIIAPVRDETTGRLLFLAPTGIDITERKRTEKALAEFARQQEALYRLSDQLHHTNSLEDVYNASLHAILRGLGCNRASILLFDDTGVMRFAAWRGLSDKYRRATEGHSPWSADEKNPYPICVSDINASDLSDTLKTTIRAEGIASLAFIPLVSNGTLIGKFMVYFDTPHDCNDVEIELGLMIARQLAFGIDRKRDEERLRESEERFTRFMQHLPGLAWIKDVQGRYVYANAAAEQAFNTPREKLYGRTDLDIFPAGVAAEFKRNDEQVLVNEKGMQTVETLKQDDGILHYSLVTKFPIPGPDGNATMIGGTAFDITERLQAEEALRIENERFMRFINSNIVGILIGDASGKIILANDYYLRLLGVSRQDFMDGKIDWKKFTPPEWLPADEKAVQELRAGGVCEPYEKEYIRTDGTRVPVYIADAMLPGPGEEIAAFVIDVTERRRAEAALHESEERLRAILSQATAGIVRKDADGRLMFVNQAYCDMLGYTEAELRDRNFWQFTYHEDIAENKRLYDRMMIEGVPFKLEKRLIRRDGSLIWVDVSVSPVMDAEGKPQSAVAVEVDITRRKQAEEALQQLNLQLEGRVQKRTATIQAINQSLREEISERKRIEEALRESEAIACASEEKLRTLFDLLPVGISFLAPQGKILQMNSALPDIVRLTKEQLLSQTYNFRKYLRPDGTPMPLTEFASARALRENRIIYNVETGIVLENGEVIWMSVSAAPVDVADVGVVVVTVDITEKKRAEQALQESHGRLRVLSRRLVEVQEEERRALARELHDRVGQTLAALNINLIIINSQLSGEAAQQIGTRLNDSMKLVAETIALVRDVMTDLRPAVLDDYGLEAALESHLTGFKSRYNIQVAFKKPDRSIPRLGTSIEMTFLRIAQEALMNIAKHSHAGHVNLSLRQDEQSICLTIRDDGIGIASWQDVNRAGSHGLTIMRERAEAFGGTLQVSSVLNQGTTLEVNIPLHRNESQKQAQEEQQL